MRPILLLTRPEPSARRFAQLAEAACPPHRALIAPLTRIEPVAFDPGIFDGAAGLILTSANAVAPLPPLPGLPAWCVGPATTRAAQEAGLAARNGGGDAAALFERLSRELPGGRWIHPHGTDLARNLAADLTARGMQVTGVPVYTARALDWDTAILDTLVQAAGIVAPLFSPRAARLFVRNLSELRPDGLRIVAISGACADQLPDDLRARAVLSERPDGAAMLARVASELSQAGSDGLRV